MAIIYTYPEINEVEGEDLLLISDTSLYKRPTRSVTIDDLAAYIGTVVGVVQNLQSVLTVGNTYVSPDGYGTFTLNDIANNDGSITFVNTYEGWGYQISAEEGINITDGSGTNLMSIQPSGLSIRNGAQIMNIGTNTLTATRNVYFPDASGTIALTSDIESYSEWAEYSGTRAGGDLLVSIGDYDDSGNGSKFKIDDDANTVYVSGSELNITDGNLILSGAGFNGQLSASNITAARTLQFPDTSGTIALTSDIPAPGPSGSGTTNYTARWTNASTLGIGALYDNGTNVGIGTTSPAEKLEVTGNILAGGGSLNKTIGFKRTDGFNLDLAKIIANGEIRIGGTNVGVITFNRSSNEVMRIASNNNVGIGTTSPSSKLHIEDSVSDGSLFKITTSTSGSLQPVFDARIASNGDAYYDLNSYKSATKKIQIKSANTSYIQQVDGTGGFAIKGHLKTSLQTVNGGGVLQLHRFGALSLNDDASYAHEPASALYINTLYNTSTDYLMLLANQGSDKLAVDLNGNVGIGTSSPSEKLDVRGNVYIEGSFPSIKLKQDTSGLQEYSIINNNNFTIEKTTLDSGGSFIIKDENGRTPLNVSMALLNPDTVISGDLFVKDKDGTTTKLYVNNENGNVGIGTTAPTTKLQVNGDVRIYDENELYFGGTGSVPHWEITASGSDLIINDTGTNVGSVLFNNDEGVALPRLTTTEINAISSPAQGLMAYNTTLNTICFYNGSSWQKVSHTNM